MLVLECFCVAGALCCGHTIHYTSVKRKGGGGGRLLFLLETVDGRFLGVKTTVGNFEA